MEKGYKISKDARKEETLDGIVTMNILSGKSTGDLLKRYEKFREYSKTYGDIARIYDACAKDVERVLKKRNIHVKQEKEEV